MRLLLSQKKAEEGRSESPHVTFYSSKVIRNKTEELQQSYNNNEKIIKSKITLCPLPVLLVRTDKERKESIMNLGEVST